MGDAPYPIRPISEAEFPAFWEVLEEALFHSTDPPCLQDPFRALLEFDRTLVAIDDHQIVGTAGAFSFEMTVPGGPRPVAGVTLVSVLPTHRRRGILTGLITRQLTDLHENGEAVAALWASESAIYGRFGYGCASMHLALTIRRGEAAYVPDAPEDQGLRLRLVDPCAAQPSLTTVYDAQASRPGFLPRNSAWWDCLLYDPEQRRGGHTPLKCVVAEDDRGTARGYALYSVRSRGDRDGLPDGTLTVRETYATDPAAYAAVWRHLFDRDLVGTVVAVGIPVDDPLRHLLIDPRRLRAQITDQLWVRVVEVDRALAERTYTAPVDVVIEVDDPLCRWNNGRWHLSGDGDGATCRRTTRPADVALPARVLGATYLGGGGLAGAAKAGLVRELRTGTLSRLSSALAWDPPPWCPMVF